MSALKGFFAAAMFLALCSVSAAQPKTAAEKPTPSLDRKTREVVRPMCDYFKGVQSLSVDMSRTLIVTAGTKKNEMASTVHLAVRRPNLVSISWERGAAQGAPITGALVCDGKNLYVSIPILKQYTASQAPADLGAVLTSRDAIPLVVDAPLLLDNLLQNNPYESVLDGVLSASCEGTEEVAGVKCNRVIFVQDNADLEIWVAASARPLLLKAVMDFTKSVRRMQGVPRDAEMKLTVLFEKWAIAPDLPDERFKFVPPEDAKKVPSFTDPNEPATVPLGQPAPDFKLPLLDGGQVALSQHKGKDIVILDFWATWCGPCRQSMPIIEEVASAFKGKGVLLYAVNQDEDAATVRRFLTEQKLNVTVALDKGSAVGAQYGASAIPLTVIVGKDGTVQAVHVGLIAGFKKILTGELDALVAGKSLAGDRE